MGHGISIDKQLLKIFFKFLFIFIFRCSGSLLLCAGFGYSLLQCMGFFWCEARVLGTRAWYLQSADLVAPGRVESSWTRDRAHVPCTGRRIRIHCNAREILLLLLMPLFFFLVAQIWFRGKRSEVSTSSMMTRQQAQRGVSASWATRFFPAVLLLHLWAATQLLFWALQVFLVFLWEWEGGRRKRKGWLVGSGRDGES